jgi:hypothetical protein
MSHDIVSDALIQMGNTHSIITRMLVEHEIQTQVNSTIYFALAVDAPKLLERVLAFVRESIQRNGFVSGLNTNYGISLFGGVDEVPLISTMGSMLMNPSTFSHSFNDKICTISLVVFYELSQITNLGENWCLFVNLSQSNASDIVWGFAASTTILQGLLESTFDCLYEWACLRVLQKYFPLLSQVCQNDARIHIRVACILLGR